MNPFALLFFFGTSIALWVMPRHRASIPLLIGCCYMTMGQGIEIGPISLPMFRMLAAVGLLRVVVKKEHIEGELTTIDKLVRAMSIWLVFASFFHDSMYPGAGPVYMSGVVFNIALAYYLARVWNSTTSDVENLVKVLALILVPVAICMVVEKVAHKNLFAVFGGVNESVLIRDGKFRAQGPFRHPILAGTVGATCLPLFIGVLRRHKLFGLVGIASGMAMVLASASSGPVMSMLAGFGALMLWHLRHHTRLMVGAAFAAYAGLFVLMERPPYYAITWFDVTGSSTGWHRARLIEQTIAFIDEWWLFGTDVTRHWMQGQGKINAFQTDITNYYIQIGVMGGLFAMVCLIALVVIAIRNSVRMSLEAEGDRDAFMIWAIGSGMFAHAVTSISISYFDQSVFFFWLNAAAIASISANRSQERFEEGEEEEEEPKPIEFRSWSRS